ncbi:ComF family protein [Desulfovibrio desulfuricans]|uniref:ComF family protein n=1 Tax=Desulfovibrio desulfuricans TaxID=876 RepID=UPI000685439B|nr:ComF family protein [Desulfovibrio desulfuricans]MDD3684508.1 ComF family protein [Desulfovibrio desulfuricans]
MQNALGLNQDRCLHCLRPFSPAFAAHPHAAPAPESLLCPQCSALLAPYAGPRCPRCGIPPSDPQAGNSICGACLQNPPPWSGAAFYGLYQGSLRHTLLRFKFDGHLYLAPLLGNFLLESVACLPRPDAIVAVPQHAAHLRRRGYNQAHELARALHDLSGLPLSSRLLSRPVPGQEQARLGARDRRSNVRHSFAASPEARGLRVWVVDDVMTTGSTMNAAASALLAGGAARVDAVFAARTPLNTAAGISDMPSHAR